MAIGSTDIFPVLAALAGAVVGGLITGLGALLQGARERRRALRVILFELLELRHQIALRDPRNVLELLSQVVAERAGRDAARELAAPEGQRLARQLVQAAAKTFSESPLGPGYEGAVQALAPYDPFLAYRLRGQTHVLQIDRAVASYFEAALALPIVGLGASWDGLRQSTEPAALDMLHRDARNRLGSHVRRVAWSLSPLAYLSARRALHDQNSVSKQAFREWFDQFLSSLPPGSIPDVA